MVSWLGECCWLDPPLHLIVRVLKHAKACSAVGTLIIPACKSAPFWPFICLDGRHLANFVHGWDAITFYEGLISVGCSGNNFSSAFYSDSIILILHINFSRPARNCRAGFCIEKYMAGSCSLCSLSWVANTYHS